MAGVAASLMRSPYSLTPTRPKTKQLPIPPDGQLRIAGPQALFAKEEIQIHPRGSLCAAVRRLKIHLAVSPQLSEDGEL